MGLTCAAKAPRRVSVSESRTQRLYGLTKGASRRMICQILIRSCQPLSAAALGILLLSEAVAVLDGVEEGRDHLNPGSSSRRHKGVSGADAQGEGSARRLFSRTCAVKFKVL